ncbi:MAG: metallophosphoesterase [Pseudomonadota bacterium]
MTFQTLTFRARLIALLTVTLLAQLMLGCVTQASERDGVERIVVVGDVHGDYEQFVAALREAGLVDKKNRWRGGNTHLVQIGDVPDRGPDTDKAIELLKKLERQARKDGGEVHALIGNHEAMMMGGDVRYVHPGEYAALTDRRSQKRQDDYYKRNVEFIKSRTPEEEWPVFDEAHRAAFNERFPVGYVELRTAWAPQGEFGKWVLKHATALRINDSLFVHAGISLTPPFQTIDAINEQVHDALKIAEQVGDDAIIFSSDGPLWNRALPVLPENEENEALLDEMLNFYGVKRIIIGHTPLVGTVLPRFGGKVILTDAGLSAYYGGARAILIIDDTGPHVLLEGQRVELPTSDQGTEGIVAYLRAAAPYMKKTDRVERFLQGLLNHDSAQSRSDETAGDR